MEITLNKDGAGDYFTVISMAWLTLILGAGQGKLSEGLVELVLGSILILKGTI